MKPAAPLLLACLASCATTAVRPPLPGAVPRDELIGADEPHLAHLWQVTFGGENAEGYWSFDGTRLALQHTDADAGIPCDRIYVPGTRAPDGARGVPLEQVSDGRGVTTCAYFLPGDARVLYATTGGSEADCPPPADYSQGYTWRVHPEYDVVVQDLASGERHVLFGGHGYDAEATVAPDGRRIVFTSTRSGDLELWSAAIDGSDLRQLTDELGYDGGAFYSHDGEQLVFRSTAFTPGKEEEERATYRQLLSEWKVRPHSMEIMLIDADGSNRRRLTHLGGASFAPFFFPDDRRVIFSTNYHEAGARNFDLFAIGVDGEGLERITTYEGFDSFPMFDPSGRWLAFASNRGGSKPGETNLFVAEWR